VKRTLQREPKVPEVAERSRNGQRSRNGGLRMVFAVPDCLYPEMIRSTLKNVDWRSQPWISHSIAGEYYDDVLLEVLATFSADEMYTT